MSDDLEAIRAQRMKELQAQSSQAGGEARNSQEEMQRQQEEMKNSILSQVLNQEARARLNTIALTKPEKAQKVEYMIAQMARSGQIQEKLGEAQLKSLLEQISGQTQKTSSVKFDRRRAALDSDSD
ncbi:programmed cell death protein 5-like [Watersipora subatra]|uniref:programmed cell death protein 5-like n=1 Tax=Watersipora subatra TaxID=2589382 RepID=UPI00355B006E